MLLKNGKEIIIRKAKKEDAQEIINYLNIVGGESNNLLFGANGFSITLEQEVKIIESANNSKTSAVFVGTVDNRIICVGSVFSKSRERVAHQGDVGLSVSKEFWNIGVGTYLMNVIIEFAKSSEQLEILHLGVKSDNFAAIALYKKFGFQEIGIYPKFYKIDDVYYDDILMNLYL